MTELPVAVELDLDRRLNYALQQNDVPVVSWLRLENRGDQDLADLTVEVTLGDDLATAWSAPLASLPAGAVQAWEAVDLALRPERLVQQTERSEATLSVRVLAAGALVGSRDEPLEVLAYNEWGGLASLPEIAAAFVLPNHPAVEGLVAEAARRLSMRTGDGALDGYGSRDRHRVRAMIDCLWEALADRDLAYVTPPASYEREGQKVRSPEQVLGSGLGTCLDLSALVAACLEQAGLAPLLVFCEGHALVGCWLVDQGFGEPALEAPLRLRKRVQLGDVLLLETTLLTHEGSVPCEEAARRAEARLADLDAVLCAIDVREARRRRIRPLPLRLLEGGYRAAAGPGPAAGLHAARELPEQPADDVEADAADALAPPAEAPAGVIEGADDTDPGFPVPDEPAGGVSTETPGDAPASLPDAGTGHDEPPAPAAPAGPADEAAGAPDDPAAGPTDAAVPEVDPAPAEAPPEREPGAARLERWKRRLLDLTLRNRLLNFRESKRTVPLVVPDGAVLEDALAAGRQFVVRDRPELMEGADPRDAAVHQERTGEDPLAAFVAEELAAGRLHADLTQAELDKRLLETWRAARVTLEESGANTLFLAVGFLTWFERDGGDRPLRAPILLLPVELQRGSVREGFAVRLTDDGPVLNVTLLEKLRVEFGLEIPGLEELPEDETGTDVTAVLQAVRRAVADFDRWDVDASACLGLFSFAKFLMWRDLSVRPDALLRNEVARHLVERPGEAFEVETAFPEAEVLDAEQSAAGVFCPLDADSSQLRAVLAAAAGGSFRLEGPPGTGKSQTITNLMAHALALGQRVLFVAEKRAALDVVASRLRGVGLGPFCLAVHGSRATKRDVLAQLEESLTVTRRDEPAAWARRAERLDGLRAELNRTVEALHGPRGFGRSVYEVMGRLEALASAPELPGPGDPTAATGRLGLTAEPLSLDGDVLDRLVEQLDRAVAALDGLGAPGQHGLAPVRRRDWTPTLEGELTRACDALRSALTALQLRVGALAARLDLVPDAAAAEGLSLPELTGLDELLRLLPGGPGLTAALLNEPDWAGLRARLEALIERAGAARSTADDLATRWSDGLAEADPGALAARLREAGAAFVVMRFFSRRGVRGELQQLARGTLADDGSVLADLDRAVALAEEQATLADPAGEAARVLGPAWDGGRGDPATLAALLERAGRIRGCLVRVTGADAERLARVRAAVVTLLTEASDLLAPGSALAGEIEALSAALGELAARRAALTELAALDHPLAGEADEGPSHLPRLDQLAGSVAAAAGDLRPWCHWQDVRAELLQAGLAAPVAALDEGSLAPEQVQGVTEKALLADWLDAVLADDEVLRGFHGGEQSRRVERFAELDAELAELARELVAARLAARLPSTAGEANARSELGLLQRELRKKRRHLPLRRLFDGLPHLLPRLKPCLLMSPQAVAQHLDPDIEPFDLVVFDEASQIPVWDAVGAIARGRSVIVVGDSRQLPPTTFFMKADDGDEEPGWDDEAVEELESLLDECAAARLPSLDLLWHYRSRHEALIAFSNAHYYDRRLLTFPAAHHQGEGLGVRLERVDGVYDRAGTRTNRVEAEAVVAELRRRSGGSQSLGVVAASLPQQQLIEELVEQARRDDPAFDALLAEGEGEPLFVKNLENVQGDERDVILLSVGYGPDTAGKVSMNFGPLNREGGERRLNVAVTRAREQVVVFSSLGPEQIDLSRTRAVGVRHLKAYLEYAASGARALPSVDGPDGAALGALGPLEQGMVAALRERGLEVDTRVGHSGYRLDLAVRDPLRPERYLLGVESDGPTYDRAPTARDRDRLRASVLGGLGWNLHRVWTVEWWLDREREVQRLVDAVDAARTAAAERDRAAAEAAADEPAATEDVEQAVGAAADDEVGVGTGGAAGAGSDAVAGDPEAPAADAQTTDTSDPAGADGGPGSDSEHEEGQRFARRETTVGTSGAARAAAEPAADAEPAAGAEPVAPADDDASTGDPVRVETEDEPTTASATDGEANAAEDAGPPSVDPPSVDPPTGRPYACAVLRSRGDAERFHDPAHTHQLGAALLELVEVEGPVHPERAWRAVAAAFGIERLIGKVKQRLTEVEATIPELVRDGEGLLVVDGRLAEGFRVPVAGDPATEREPDELPAAELAAAAAHVLAINISLPVEDLVREVGRLFGYQRTGKQIEAAVRRGVERLHATGGCRVGEGVVSLP